MRLIRGAPGSGKTALVFREFKEALKQSRNAPRIVVPTATLVRHFQHELARDGVVLPPASVVSLNRFVRQRAEGADATKLTAAKLAPEGLVQVVVRSVLSRLALPEFAEVAEAGGMASTILDTISLFENAGCTPDRLRQSRRLSAHGKAFERIWRAVEDAVRGCGFLTRGDIFRAAASNSEPLRVWLDGFLNFSPLERDLAASLARCCDLTIALSDSPAADEFRRFAMQLNAEDRLLPGRGRHPEITVVSAPSIEREADEIARRIIELHDRGTAFREIGIALRDAVWYAPLLRGTFERYGIPARFYFGAPLRSHPAAAFLGGIVACALEGWDYAAALDAFASHPQWGHSAAFDHFDFRVREAMPGRGAAGLVALCEDERLRGRIAEAASIDAWQADSAAPAIWRSRFEQLAERLYRPGMVDPPRDRAEVETARSHAAAARAWVQAVDSAAASWPDPATSVTLAAFWPVAREAIDSATFQSPDDRRDAVHAMNVYEARQWDIPTLFVCGMSDRDFPRRSPPNLLFPDAEIAVLRKAGIPLPDPAARDAEEDALWHALRTRAQNNLILTYARHDAGGKSAASSRYLADFEIEPARLSRATPAAMAAGAGVAGRVDSPELLGRLAAHHQNIGITSLEDLVQCRFRFFAGRTLGLKSRPERPQDRLDPRLKGLILHEALEAWLNQNRQGDFVALFETAFDKACREKHLPPGYRLEMERIVLREVARKVNATERWESLQSLIEVELKVDFPGGIVVSGRADRIDLLNERDCIIVDYKSGKTGNVERLAQSRVKLQGPLYALGARERLGLNTIAMMYVAVREDKRFGWGTVPGVDLGLSEMPPDWIDAARERAVGSLSSFLGGAIHAEPVEPENCRWCDFKNACHIEERQALVMVEGSHG